MKKQIVSLVVALFTVSMFIFPGTILSAPYFENKVIKIICGNEAGGGYDRMCRLLAKHLPKHIPGKPALIVENMVGADSMIAANYLYSIAKPDGLTIGNVGRNLHIVQMLNVEGVRYDMTKFSWIGSSAVDAMILALRTDVPYKTIDDLRKTKDPIYLASMSTSGQDYQFAKLLKELLGFNFKMVVYRSGSAGLLAIEKGEAVGKAGSYSSLKPAVERGLVRPWIRGAVSEPGIENLPVNEDLTTDPKAKAIFRVFSSQDRIGRPFLAPPGLPAEVIDIFRNAFAKVADDPELKEDSKKLMMPVEYVPADECLRIVNYAFDQSPEFVKDFGKYIK